MEDNTIILLTNYLISLEYPQNATKSDITYPKKNAHKFVLHDKVLYRFNPEVNAKLKKVLNKEQAIEAIETFGRKFHCP
ncbi:hypothetical protein A0J61_11571 [Choanephora cucurbitarum]|uniref:Uncharacterized protein n=1 Tax=Choanephora cucurbitarum TaxID=101091 RepID=A0A1C7MU64_9FUNG|nr:hypothetical protein A0J61_11571 [Choanephora cucurbitarum]